MIWISVSESQPAVGFAQKSLFLWALWIGGIGNLKRCSKTKPKQKQKKKKKKGNSNDSK